MTLCRESQLLEQIEDLKEAVRYWRDLAEGTMNSDLAALLAHQFGLSVSEAHLLVALYEAGGKFLNKERLQTLCPARRKAEDERSSNLVQVFLCRLRKKLGTDSIRNQWGFGYRISDDLVRRIDIIKEGGLQCDSSSPATDWQSAKSATAAIPLH